MKLLKVINLIEMGFYFIMIFISGIIYSTFPEVMTYDAGYSKGTFNGMILLSAIGIMKTYIFHLLITNKINNN